jgi:hypothetical protein
LDNIKLRKRCDSCITINKNLYTTGVTTATIKTIAQAVTIETIVSTVTIKTIAPTATIETIVSTATIGTIVPIATTAAFQIVNNHLSN